MAIQDTLMNLPESAFQGPLEKYKEDYVDARKAMLTGRTSNNEKIAELQEKVKKLQSWYEDNLKPIVDAVGTYMKYKAAAMMIAKTLEKVNDILAASVPGATAPAAAPPLKAIQYAQKKIMAALKETVFHHHLKARFFGQPQFVRVGQYLMFGSLDYLTFALGASMFGFGVGGVVPMHGAVVGKTFGRDRFGAVLGLMRPAMFPIQILGVPFAGWIFDVTGSYDTAFQVFLGLYFLAALAVSFYRQPAKTVT